MDSIVEENGNSSNNVDDANAATGGSGGGGGVGHNLTVNATQTQQPATTHINLMNSNNLQQQQHPSSNQIPVSVSVAAAAALAAGSVLSTASNIVQYMPTNPHGLPVSIPYDITINSMNWCLFNSVYLVWLQVQSVIQAANQSSVIQTAAGNNTQAPVAIPKGTVLFKPNATVIHTTSGNAVQVSLRTTKCITFFFCLTSNQIVSFPTLSF